MGTNLSDEEYDAIIDRHYIYKIQHPALDISSIHITEKELHD